MHHAYGVDTLDRRSLLAPLDRPIGTRDLRPLAVLKGYLGGHQQATLIAPDATLEGSGLPSQLRGRNGIAGYWAAFYGAIGEQELSLETAFEAGDRAVAVLRIQGIHRGRLLGHPPTGRRLDLPLIVLAHVHGGEIRHLRVSFDRLALCEQLGAA